MKNKLLKTLICFASVFAIGSTIAITSTSCGCSNTVLKILPYEVYDIDETTNALKGFKDAFLNDPTSEIYKDNFKNCDIMEIPARVTSIADEAFVELIDSEFSSIIPSFITNLTFAEGSNCSSIGQGAFQNSSSLTSIDLSKCISLITILDYVFKSCSLLTSVTFPSSLTKIQEYVFYSCSKLNYIAWDLPDEYETKINISGYYTFYDISSSGTVESLNTSVASSQQLLDWIKTKGSFPSGDGWRIP